MSKVKAPYGFCAKLGEDLSPNGTLAKLDGGMDDLCAQLAGDCYTYMIISDCFSHEIVKVTCSMNMLTVERGQQDTTARKWCKGAKFFFECTPQLAADQLACASEDDDSANGIKSDSLEVTPDEDDPTKTCIELKDKLDKEHTLCVNGYIYTYNKAGILCGVKRDPDVPLIKDAKYVNATMCYKDGKLISIEDGGPTVANSSKCGCNCCNKCDKCDNREGNLIITLTMPSDGTCPYWFSLLDGCLYKWDDGSWVQVVAGAHG